MAFLYTRSFCAWRADANVDVRRCNQFTSGLARHCDRVQTHFFRYFEGEYYIWRIPAGRDADCYVACLSEGFNLPRENVLETVIVRDGGQARSIRVERNCGQRRTLHPEAAYQISGKMLGVRSTSSIPEKQDFVAD